MLGAGRTQQQQGAAEGAAGDDDDVGRIALLDAVAGDVDGADAPAAGVGLQPADVGPAQQGDVRMRREHRVDADHLGVGLAVERAGEAVEGVAPDAGARAHRQAVLLVEQDAERQVERPDALCREAVVQCLDARFVGHRIVRKRAVRRRLDRILAALAVDVEEALGLGVVRLEDVVLQRPRGGDAVDVRHRVEVALAEAQEGGAVDLRVAADVVVQARVKGLAILAVPGLRRLVAAVHEDLARAPVGGLARQVVAALDDQDALATGRDPLRQRAAARPAADHDQVVVVSHRWRTPGTASCRHRRRASCR